MDHSLNFIWVLACGFLVMFMQAGFALLETGLCRAKNAAHVMSMNLLVYALGMTAFWACGFAFMCGGVNGTPIGGPAALGLAGPGMLDHMFTLNGWGILGHSGFFLRNAPTPGMFVWFMFMVVFMDTAATIPTGALAERWSFKSFFFFSLLIGGLIYPIYGCWVWGGGWIAQLGIKAGLGHGGVDFAGSTVVHLQGGTIALVACVLLGPRIGKYDSRGNPRPILGHHIPMVMLGTFILAFGWFGFNAGSALSGSSPRLGQIVVNTMLASVAGSLSSTLYLWKRFGKPDPSMMCNGMLSGLVAITASCAFVSPTAAFVIGAVAGLIGDMAVFFFERKRIDDPVGAISVHAVNGLWGTLALGLFASESDPHATWNGVAGPVRGLFYGGGWSQLAAQAIMAAACIAWAVVVGGGLFWILGKLLGSNRVPPEVEIAGLDIPELGAPGYPEFISIVSTDMSSME